MEEEISAIELVITEYLNSNLKNYNDLAKLDERINSFKLIDQ